MKANDVFLAAYCAALQGILAWGDQRRSQDIGEDAQAHALEAARRYSDFFREEASK